MIEIRFLLKAKVLVLFIDAVRRATHNLVPEGVRAREGDN